jgi:hypothetical protein
MTRPWEVCRMRNLILVMLLSFAAMAIGSCAIADNTPGHDFYVDCLVVPPDPPTFPDYEYIYTIENFSTDHAIESWTWSYGAMSGSVIPTSHDNPQIFEYPEEAGWPLPASGVDDADTAYRSELFDDAAEPVAVASVVRFDDGYEESVDGVFLPSSLVPEPGSVLAFLSGCAGLIGFGRRRRA